MAGATLLDVIDTGAPIIDKDYQQWVQQLSKRFRQNQIKAAVQVNQEMIRFYWELGRDISDRNAENKYGSGFYKQLSIDLREMIPNATELSETAIRYAKRMYCLYSQLFKILPQVGEILEDKILPKVEEKLDDKILPLVVEDLENKNNPFAEQLQNDLFSAYRSFCRLEKWRYELPLKNLPVGDCVVFGFGSRVIV